MATCTTYACLSSTNVGAELGPLHTTSAAALDVAEKGEQIYTHRHRLCFRLERTVKNGLRGAPQGERELFEGGPAVVLQSWLGLGRPGQPNFGRRALSDTDRLDPAACADDRAKHRARYRRPRRILSGYRRPRALAARRADADCGRSGVRAAAKRHSPAVS